MNHPSTKSTPNPTQGLELNVKSPDGEIVRARIHWTALKGVGKIHPIYRDQDTLEIVADDIRSLVFRRPKDPDASWILDL